MNLDCATSWARENEHKHVPKVYKVDEMAELRLPAFPSLSPRMKSLK